MTQPTMIATSAEVEEHPLSGTEPVAWRFWGFEHGRLISPFLIHDAPTVVWRTTTMTAGCDAELRCVSEVDRGYCKCGIYACLSRDELEGWVSRRAYICAQVKLHGRIWPGQNPTDPPSTVRADAATIVGPFALPFMHVEHRQALEEAYGLPVEVGEVPEGYHQAWQIIDDWRARRAAWNAGLAMPGKQGPSIRDVLATQVFPENAGAW